MFPPVRTGALVGAGFVAVGGAAVGLPGAVADATGAAVGGAVGAGAAVSAKGVGGTGLGSTGGVAVGPGGSVGGWAGRGVLVGVGVGPEATGEQELNASPADTSNRMSAQSN